MQTVEQPTEFCIIRGEFYFGYPFLLIILGYTFFALGPLYRPTFCKRLFLFRLFLKNFIQSLFDQQCYQFPEEYM